MKTLFAALGVGVFGVFCVIVLQVVLGSHGGRRTEPASTVVASSAVAGEDAGESSSPVARLDAAEYASAYHANEVLADERYKGHRVAITGVVRYIRKDFTDSAYVEMVVPGRHLGGIRAEFAEASAHGAATLSPGSAVTLVCAGDGMTLEEPLLKNCSIERQPERERLSPKPSPVTSFAVAENPVAAHTASPPASREEGSTDLRRHYEDPQFGYQFDYPASYRVTGQTAAPNSITIESPDGSVSLLAIGSASADHTVAEAYARERGVIHAEPTYEAKGKNWVVLSWRDAGKAFYLKRFVGPEAQNTFIISFPQADMDADSFLPTMVEHSFRPGNLAVAR